MPWSGDGSHTTSDDTPSDHDTSKPERRIDIGH